MSGVVSLLPTIVAKSDQLNADDLIGGSQTIRVTKVSLTEATDQPIAIYFEGDNGKPYLPCKSMRRVMVHIWGDDGNQFAGQRMTLYRDAGVQFGGMAVGGIRISHISGIDRETSMALNVTRGKKKLYTVRPLQAEQTSDATSGQAEKINLKSLILDGRVAAAGGSAALTDWWGGISKAEKAAVKPTLDSELKALAAKADQKALETTDDEPEVEFGDPVTADDDVFPGDRPSPAAATAKAPDEANNPSGEGEMDPVEWEAWAREKIEMIDNLDDLDAFMTSAETQHDLGRLLHHSPDLNKALVAMASGKSKAFKDRARG